MRVGTKSVLFGAHCFFLHGFFTARGWWILWGFPWDPRLWLSFFVHDAGYFSSPNMEGSRGEEHVQLGARIMGALFGPKWADFTLRHSRHWTKKHGVGVSRLCYADKIAFAITPAWLYLPMARASGELREYMAKSRDRQAGNGHFTAEESRKLASADSRVWLEGLQSYTLRWVAEHRDGREDRWTEDQSERSKAAIGSALGQGCDDR
jgi:hypothetical protein